MLPIPDELNDVLIGATQTKVTICTTETILQICLVLRINETVNVSLNIKTIFVMEMWCVFFDVGTKLLNIIQIKFEVAKTFIYLPQNLPHDKKYLVHFHVTLLVICVLNLWAAERL
jgi:hypothetical protein